MVKTRSQWLLSRVNGESGTDGGIILSRFLSNSGKPQPKTGRQNKEILESWQGMGAYVVNFKCCLT